jgi:hypothetical protein
VYPCIDSKLSNYLFIFNEDKFSKVRRLIEQ